MAKTKPKTAIIPISKADPDLAKLGKRIRSLRKALGYKSAEKFALDHQFSRVHYGRWEAGQKNITFKSLKLLVKAFNITLSQFFSEGFD